ncbi:MAG: hypothetical protein HY928_05795 [Elusimicrobia bacterium]|nr:hypothetical protein [Elusimicrobiota bacterium]
MTRRLWPPKPADAAGLSALFAFLLAARWGRWADPLVDFGRELYQAWRLGAGDSLYADLAHLHGPLSQWWNGLLFRLTGPSLRALVLSNLAVLALETALLHRLLARACGRAGATTGAAVFLCLFGFGDFTTYGVFSHATPYSHEATHGLLLALAVMEAAFHFEGMETAGLLWGLCALTKPEPALAALAGCAAAGLLRGRGAAAFAGAALLAPLAAWLFLAPAAGGAAAARGVAGSWAAPLADPRAMASLYARGFAGSPSAFFSPDWLEWARALPVLILVLAWKWGRGGAVRLGLCAFAWVLLAKIMFAARIHQYGFTLAAPGAALLAAAAMGRRRTRRALAAGAAAGFCVLGVLRSQQRAAERTYRLGSGADAFLCDRRGAVLAPALARLSVLVKPEGTLAVWPEGAMLNYLSRRRNPTPYLNLLPVELAVWGEAEVLAAYRRAPPDAILLVHRETPEFGQRLFGTDYGRELLAWAGQEYAEAGRVGDPPLVPGSRFGATLLLRRR